MSEPEKTDREDNKRRRVADEDGTAPATEGAEEDSNKVTVETEDDPSLADDATDTANTTKAAESVPADYTKEREKLLSQLNRLEQTVTQLGGATAPTPATTTATTTPSAPAPGPPPTTAPPSHQGQQQQGQFGPTTDQESEQIVIRAMFNQYGPKKIIEVPNAKVGLIIGKSGTMFRQIQDESGAHMFIPDESAPGASYREVTVQGDASKIAKCEGLILSRILGRGFNLTGQNFAGPSATGLPVATIQQHITPKPGAVAPGSTEESYVFSVPNEVVGIIIGRQGSTFKQIQEESQCFVHIPKDPTPGSPFREITLRGSVPRMQVCYQMIMKKIEPALTKVQQAAGTVPPQVAQQPQQQAWQQQSSYGYPGQGQQAQYMYQQQQGYM